jgi:precorrin-2 dehydrogenase/sirohydrochlorin ferrochelatase
VFCRAPDDEVRALAGGRLRQRLPTRRDMAPLQAIWVAGLDADIAGRIAADARAEKALVNVEDVLPFCDFHTPAIVRRGALVLAASTGGASPAAARLARETLEAAFPEGWSAALDELAEARARARAAGRTAPAIIAEARAILARRGLDRAAVAG